MTTRSITEMLFAIEHISKRPRMYVGRGIPETQVFLDGFRTAINLAFPNLGFDQTHLEVRKEHGWWHSTTPAWELMKQQGLSDDEIMQKLLDMHFEAWKRIAESLEPETTTTGNGVPK